MTWPTADVDVTNVDSSNDNTLLARQTLLTFVENVNSAIGHVGAAAQTLLNASTTASAQAALGITLPSTFSDLPAILDSRTGPVSVNSTTTETVVFSTTIPGQALGSTRALRIMAVMGLLCNNGNNIHTVRMQYGSSVFATIVTSTNSCADRRPLYVTGMVTAQASTGSQIGYSFAQITGAQSASTVSSGIPATGYTSFMRELGIQTNSNQLFSISVQHGTGNSITTLTSAEVELL